MTGEDASDERRDEVREVLGLNDPVYIQFGRFLGNIVHGNFGISYQLKR
jgi:ABC-type dipeptide/oligopeptide/nickel transport system permease component